MPTPTGILTVGVCYVRYENKTLESGWFMLGEFRKREIWILDENHILARVQAHQDWEKARQAAVVEDVLNIFARRQTDLLSFDDVQRRLGLAQKHYKGLQEISLEQIRGSVGRYRDFTRTFLPRLSQMRGRWERVSAVAYSRGFPPIEVYKVGDAYFVLDGNHRVSVARQSDARSIQAHVWEYDTPVGLSGEADLNEVLIKEEYAEFLEQTHLDRIRPDQDIQFTAPGRYRELEYQIALYRIALEKIDGEPIEYEYAVTAWYDMIYTPAVDIICERDILPLFPGRTEADLFAWVWRYNKELRERTGSGSLTRSIDNLLQDHHDPLGRVWSFLRRLLGKEPII